MARSLLTKLDYREGGKEGGREEKRKRECREGGKEGGKEGGRKGGGVTPWSTSLPQRRPGP